MESGIVRKHVERIYLENVKFVVRPAGRQRVLETKRKNVHAFVKGAARAWTDVPLGAVRVSYNPYKSGDFCDHEGRPVKFVERAWVTAAGVWVVCKPAAFVVD
jgi:hypothetical protein